MGPARGGADPIVLFPGGLLWTRRRAGVGFRRVVPEPHVRRGSFFFVPAVKNTAGTGSQWGADGFIEVVVKPNNAGGSVPPLKSGPEPLFCILLCVCVCVCAFVCVRARTRVSTTVVETCSNKLFFCVRPPMCKFKVVIITNLGQGQKSA